MHQNDGEQCQSKLISISNSKVNIVGVDFMNDMLQNSQMEEEAKIQDNTCDENNNTAESNPEFSRENQSENA